MNAALNCWLTVSFVVVGCLVFVGHRPRVDLMIPAIRRIIAIARSLPGLRFRLNGPPSLWFGLNCLRQGERRLTLSVAQHPGIISGLAPE
jgi:hypothetical protein